MDTLILISGIVLACLIVITSVSEHLAVDLAERRKSQKGSIVVSVAMLALIVVVLVRGDSETNVALAASIAVAMVSDWVIRDHARDLMEAGRLGRHLTDYTVSPARESYHFETQKEENNGE